MPLMPGIIRHGTRELVLATLLLNIRLVVI